MQEMLRKWSYIEADFQREYRINLAKDEISYRRFRALMNGLSSDSTFANYLFSLKKEDATGIEGNYRHPYQKKKLKKYDKTVEREIDRVWN